MINILEILKKSFIIFLLFTLLGCLEHSDRNDNVIKIKHNSIECIKSEPMKKVLCPECHGTGKVKQSIGTTVYLTIITLGAGLMTADDLVTCPTCNGFKYIEVPDLNN